MHVFLGSLNDRAPRFEDALQETPSSICKRLLLTETRVIDLHFCRW